MAERGLSVDHTTVCAGSGIRAEVRRRLQGHVKYKRATWFMDETQVRIARRRMYLCRAVDDRGQTISTSRNQRPRRCKTLFLQAAVANPDNRAPYILTMDGNRSYRRRYGS